MSRERGFTLIELLASLSILLVLAGVGAPSFVQFLERQQIDAAMQRLETDLTLARTTAISRRQSVVVCPRDMDGTCAPGLDWSHGWVVFAEHSGQPDEVLWMQRPLSNSGKTMDVRATRQLLRYRFDGTSSGSNLTIHLCLHGQLVGQQIINNSGRLRRQQPVGDVACSA